MESLRALPVDSFWIWFDRREASTEVSPNVASGFFMVTDICFWWVGLDISLTDLVVIGSLLSLLNGVFRGLMEALFS